MKFVGGFGYFLYVVLSVIDFIMFLSGNLRRWECVGFLWVSFFDVVEFLYFMLIFVYMLMNFDSFVELVVVFRVVLLRVLELFLWRCF